MAEKKTAATRKKSSSRSSKQAAPKAPPKPSYDDLVAARRLVEETAEEVATAKRGLMRARTYLGDFTDRDRRIAAAQVILDEASAANTVATKNFEALKKAAG